MEDRNWGSDKPALSLKSTYITHLGIIINNRGHSQYFLTYNLELPISIFRKLKN
jgi:hypothetical protein